MTDQLDTIKVLSINKDGVTSQPQNLKWEQNYGFHIAQTFNKDYFLAIKFEDMEEWGDGDLHGTNASIMAVSIKALGKKRMDKILSEFGMGETDKNISRIEKLTLALDNGSSATLWSQVFNEGEDEETSLSEDQMLTETKAMAERINIMLGFYLDRTQNGMGATGWDFVKGENMPLAMRRSINARRAFYIKAGLKKRAEEIKKAKELDKSNLTV